jgi:HAD superfamily hydrolase (TIGR01509 family)
MADRPPVRAVLFDVDGTLIDSNYLHVVAWSRAFAQAGRAVPAARIHRLIGMSGTRLMETLLGAPDDDVADEWRRQFERMKPELRAFDGAADLLRALATGGTQVGLATSSPEEDLEALRQTIDADDAVSFVTSAGDVTEAKPAPDIFAVALERAGVPTAEAIVVGDTVWDVAAAQRCGLPCVGVLTGGISRAELTEAGAVAVYDDVAQLLAGLDGSPLRRSRAG